jgi:multisubunit Na+/H+ antiporter MnhF subunit
MELFSAIPEPLGLAILLNVGWMILSIALEIARILLKPEFDPRVIGMATTGMLSSPAGTVLSV